MADVDNYFRRPSIIWLILVPIGLALVAVSHLCPQHLPREYMFVLGPLGNLTLLLVDKYPQVLAGIFYATTAIHIGETLYAYHLCQQKKLANVTQWCAQTFVYGITSLKYLISYRPKQQ